MKGLMVVNVKETTRKTSACLTTEGRRFFVQVNHSASARRSRLNAPNCRCLMRVVPSASSMIAGRNLRLMHIERDDAFAKCYQFHLPPFRLNFRKVAGARTEYA